MYFLGFEPSDRVEGEAGGDRGASAITPHLTIAGLQLLEPGAKQPGHVKEKQDHDTSATALGYVAHVSLNLSCSPSLLHVSSFSV